MSTLADLHEAIEVSDRAFDEKKAAETALRSWRRKWGNALKKRDELSVHLGVSVDEARASMTSGSPGPPPGGESWAEFVDRRTAELVADGWVDSEANMQARVERAVG